MYCGGEPELAGSKLFLFGMVDTQVLVNLISWYCTWCYITQPFTFLHLAFKHLHTYTYTYEEPCLHYLQVLCKVILLLLRKQQLNLEIKLLACYCLLTYANNNKPLNNLISKFNYCFNYYEPAGYIVVYE